MVAMPPASIRLSSTGSIPVLVLIPCRRKVRIVPVAKTGSAWRPRSANGAATREAFDDLACLRSVVDPATQAGVVRAAGTTDQQKTLRCTECSTMNLPTEWYCERCGGELAAF